MLEPPRVHAILLFGLAALASAAARAQPSDASARTTDDGTLSVFGVAAGSRSEALEELATRTHTICRAAAPVRSGTPPREALPVVCARPLVETPGFFAVSATYWYEDDALARAYLLVTAPASTMADARAQFDALHAWLAHALGPPTQPLQLPPGWAGRGLLSDADQLSLLLAGRARLSIVWRRPGASIELWLAGENGRPVVAVGLRGADAGPRCGADAVASALLDLFPPAAAPARASAARQLAACHVTRAAGALGAALAQDDAPAVKAEARRALAALAATPAPVAAAPVIAPARPARAAPPRVEQSDDDAEARPVSRAPAPAPLAASPPAPSGSVSGTPLAIGASTIAGATLIRNLGLMGGAQLAGVTPQLLLGSAGAVIGFGTSWGLSRFGFRPTVEQAAWYTNAAAWGTLGGVALWSVSGSDNPKVKYGLPVLGEAFGMSAGVWSARKWSWTTQQLVLSDSLLLGAGLTSLGVSLIAQPRPQLTLTDALLAPFAMVGAAVAARFLDPTPRDVGLMTTSALAGGWTGGLLASGLAGADFLGSHQSWGGVATGAGLGYLGGAFAGAFTETSAATLGVGAAGLLTGNVLGLGLHLTLQGFSRDDVPGAAFTADEVHARATSAAVGGVVLAGAALAAAPHLRLTESTLSLTVAGILYGAGTWWLASEASYDGRPTTDVSDARLEGGLLTGAALGGLTGFVAARWLAPDGGDQATAALGAALGVGAGLGLAKLTTDTKGAPDALGVLFGAGVGLAGGALSTRVLALRPPDLGGGALGLATGLLVGELVPTIRWDSWQDSRVTAGSTLLAMSLGAGAGIAVAHATQATGGEVGVATAAGGIGLLAGLGLGFAQPCGALTACTSQAPRVGALVGSLSLMGGALALEPTLHLATTLGPDAGKLAVLGGTFGIADGLLLAGALAPDGVISGTTPRQAWGGILFGTSLEAGAGVVASKYVRLQDGDRLFLASGKVAGGLFGLGAAMLARDHTGAHDTLATLAGSLGGLAAATAAQVYTPLDATDGAAAATGAAFGAFVGALVPTLDEPTWTGLDHRRTGGGLLLGLSGGALAGAAVSHATDASSRALGLTVAGGLDGLVSGLGVGLLLSDEASSRPTRLGLVAGTGAGLALGGLVWPRLSPGPDDGATIAVAGTLGAWTGAWLPTLGHASFGDVSASNVWGGLLAGGGLATIGASLVAPRLALDADLLFDAVTVDALWTAAGAGAGALLSTRDDAPAWGLLGAGTAGLLLGGALHDRIAFDETTAPALAFAGVEGAWLGGWIPDLLDAPTGRQRAGALALGGFGALGLAAVSPLARIDDDVLADAAGLDVLFTGAGAGAGALVSPSEKAPVWGLLGAGTAGLLLGGALHRSIELDAADAPLLTLATGEGLWFGGWLPSLLHASGDVTGRQRAGGLALGGFGGAAAATLVSGAYDLPAATGGFGALGSALGASLGGGVALLSPSRHDQGSVGLMLGGTALGLAAGVGLAPRLDSEPTAHLLGGAAAGATLGVSESLLFAWSGRATGGAAYGGAALVGGSLGASLGLAASLTPSSDRGSAPATAGFAAWGAFSGSLAGSLVGYDPHAIVFGGLIGANAGFLTGYALMRSEVVEPRDFGWLSLFGGLGTVLGAGAGASFSSGSSAPLRAGLAAGPVVGMLAGALVLPRLRRALTPDPSPAALAEPAGSETSETEAHTVADATTARVPASARAGVEASSLSHRLAQVGAVTDWQPLLGALPASPDGGPAPVLFGLMGHWK